MIISASRRTDIPSFYSPWFLERLREGFLYVRNPMNPHRVSRISLLPADVDGIVFWTKNPRPMLPHLDELDAYTYYFQFTVTAYGRDMESGVPSKNDVILPAFRALSERIGAERVIWRYDPIIHTEKYTADYHVRYFRALAERLSGYTEKCVISFVDFYRNTQAHLCPLGLLPMEKEQMIELACRLAEIADKYNLIIESCAEEIDFAPYGIRRGHCIDGELFARLRHGEWSVKKDKNQRPACGCMESVDIGAYNTCANGCRYCYANYLPGSVRENAALHDPHSPLLIGHPTAEDSITERKTVSLYKPPKEREEQLSL